MERQRVNQPLYISEDEVKKFLSWPLVFDACEQALRSVCKAKASETQPMALQPARQRLTMQKHSGTAFSMLGLIHNYKLVSINEHKTFDTLGHKLVTYFHNNQELEPPLPNILATIFLFDTVTGKLQSIIEGTEITAWRTAACSIVSTKYLYFNRMENPTIDTVLAIVGCGAQGRIHALGMCSIYNISEIHLWNRTKSKAETLAIELDGVKTTFQNKNVKIIVHDTVTDCVSKSDVIVIATNTSSPLLFANMLKANAHINAVGAGVNHHAEIDGSVYERSKIYVDSWTGAESELKTLHYPIEGEVGEVINGIIGKPTHSLTIFHSMGMAVEDAAVGQLIFELYQKDKRTE